MSSDNSFSEILKRLKNNISDETLALEGTWTADLLQAVANEMARTYSMDIEPAYKKAFVTTASGDDLDRCCADYGVERTQATYAEGNVKLIGTPGTYQNLKVAADNIIFTLPDEVVIPENGEVTVRCVCTEPGTAGNVRAESIDTVIPTNYQITKVINEAPTFEGYEAETDDSLRERTLEYINEPPTSGNIANYKQWSLEVSGVEAAQIYDLARGNGTVDVVIIADGSTVATQQLLNKVADYIEDKRPIGADVKVSAATALEITITASVKAKSGYSGDFISSTLYTLLNDYLAKLSGNNPLISYIKMADIIFSCEGVEDVTDYTLNGGKISITVENRYFPKAVMPVITVEE